MIKWLAKRKEKKEQKKKLKQMREYYKIVKCGLEFIKFVQGDIADQKKNKINRAQRRRFERELSKEGKLTPEIVQSYAARVDNVLAYIEMQTNPPKIKKGKLEKGSVKPKPITGKPSKPSAGNPCNKKTPFNNDETLKAEYKLVQEKKSNLPVSERKRVVSLYTQRFAGVKNK